MRPLCILVTGEPVRQVELGRGSFAELIIQAAAYEGQDWAVVDARRDDLPELGQFAGLVVTGSASSVTEHAAWMLNAQRYLAAAVQAEHPLLGICFGHQLLGEALGGRVERNPNGREMGTVDAELLERDEMLPEANPFSVNTTHVDSIVELPAGAKVLARTALEPHAAVRFGARAWGVQFHPEFDAGVMRGYIAARSEILRQEGANPGALMASAAEAHPGREVLQRFVRYVSAPTA